MPRHPVGVFCLETGNYWEDLRRHSSVEPLLELIGQYHSQVPALHRDVATCAEFKYYVGRWLLRKYDQYPILYVASHGDETGIELADGSTLGLKDLRAILGRKARSRLLHMGACRSLSASDEEMSDFLAATGLLAVSGYRGDVDWGRSAALDYLVFTELSSATYQGVTALKRRLSRLVPGLIDELGFRIEVRPVSRRTLTGRS